MIKFIKIADEIIDINNIKFGFEYAITKSFAVCSSPRPRGPNVTEKPVDITINIVANISCFRNNSSRNRWDKYIINTGVAFSNGSNND